VSYSLDDITPPRPTQNVGGSLIAWIVCGHVPWVVGLAWLGSASEYRVALVGAFAHIVGIFFALLAWDERRRSKAPAVVAAFVSTTLLGVGSVLCAGALVAFVWGAFTFPPADPNAMDDMSPIFIGALIIGAAVAAVVAVPTIGGFAAAISLARDLRDAKRVRTPRIETRVLP
jgi:hypothetical protein